MAFTIEEILEYRQSHSEKETCEKFDIRRNYLRDLVKGSPTYKPHSMPEEEVLLQAVEAVKVSFGDQQKAARILNKPESTVRRWLSYAEKQGLWSSEDIMLLQVSKLKHENSKLKQIIKDIEKSQLSTDEVRTHIYKLSDLDPTPPQWLTSTKHLPKNSPGVPTLLCSDIHWGEVVDPSHINGINEYNMTIAEQRLGRMLQKLEFSLFHQLSNPNYPGIVFVLGGDLFSGDIHESLTATNEDFIMPAFSSLFGVLVEAILYLKSLFGKVFVVVIPGNHSRTTKKVESKMFNATNFDYLMGLQLEKFFQLMKDTDVSFHVPNGTDALYSLYGYRYLATHGNQFRGGDGMIGPIGPIFRGDHKKRSRNAQINMEFDTMVMGHFHTLMMLERVIVNGSVVGYNEYAADNNFPYEPPQQALWVTEPTEGITFQRKLVLSEPKEEKDTRWVSVFR